MSWGVRTGPSGQWVGWPKTGDGRLTSSYGREGWDTARIEMVGGGSCIPPKVLPTSVAGVRPAGSKLSRRPVGILVQPNNIHSSYSHAPEEGI